MPTGTVIEFSHLGKHVGATPAVTDLSFTVQPGRVTGFLGPNGVGKTTKPAHSGGAGRRDQRHVDVRRGAYRDLTWPPHTVSVALEAASFHPGRPAAHHLAMYTTAAGLPRSRVGGYSLGVRQRLGLAFALLGDRPGRAAPPRAVAEP